MGRPGRHGSGFPRKPGRGSRENVALQPKLLVLAPPPDQLIALGRSQPVALLLPAALLLVGLHDPGADRLRRRLELTGKILRRPASSDEVNHLPTELR